MEGVREGKGDGRAHLLLVPLEEQGHFTVFLQLLYFLNRYEIRVTFCSTKTRIAQLRKLQSDGDFQQLDLRLFEVFFEPSSDSRAKGQGEVPKLMLVSNSMEAQFQPFLNELMTTEDGPNAKPTALLADLVLPWTKDVAHKLDIPRYLIFTTAAWVTSWCVLQKLDGIKDNDVLTLPGFTNPICVSSKVLPTVLSPLLDLTNAAGLLCNSFEALERIAIDTTRARLRELPFTVGTGKPKIPKLLPIGPMLHLMNPSAAPRGPDTSSTCLQWLDEQAPESVLYVAFGTQAHVGSVTNLELARGLEASTVPFLWVLRLSPGASLASVLPEGFEERTKGQGIVVSSFVPQVQILNHGSTGGFLSHCGWNSTMESISAGVPILACPMHGDQPVNARLLVEVVHIGLILPRTTQGDLSQADVTEKVRALMLEKEGRELRRKAREVKLLARESLEEGGTSSLNLKSFMEDILNKS